jgi:protein-tyrosine phosphatase
MFFFKVRAQGLKPVLAHPERSDIDSAVARDFFDYLMKNGALIQCDLLSLTGRWGRRAADNAMRLLHKGVVAAFATDIHCRESDFEELPGAIEQLRKAAGAEAAGRLLGDNPADILAGRRPRWISYDD